MKPHKQPVIQAADPPATSLADAPCFIETQFPVAKVSMESYKERKAGGSQSLTGLGKWWGRKPLVLVRAVILGLLMPASDDPVKDREIFLKLMTMDRDGLNRRKSKSISGKRLVEELQTMPPSIRNRYLDKAGTQLKRLSRDERAELQHLVFERMSYDEKLAYCDRPEQIDGPSPEAWAEINANLQTRANSLPELVEELGKRRFGHRPCVGDAFCGGGSVPFEAARLGCDAYGSDLNPVAALLTWAALNLIGGGEETAKATERAQQQVWAAVNRQVTAWGIEHNSLGWRADAYLYCVEVIDPETGWRVPLAPSWVIAEKNNVIAKLVPDEYNKRYDIEILEGASDEELRSAQNGGTIDNSRVRHPMGVNPVPIEVIRQTMRMWENSDIVPRPDDVFQERLYCIRWVETYTNVRGLEELRRHYRAPSQADSEREDKVLRLLRERFTPWQDSNYIPRRRIEPGEKTDEPIRTRGWTYWHHLFTARQLLLHGLISSNLARFRDELGSVGSVLGLMACCDWNSRLCRWDVSLSKSGGIGFAAQTFYNQALNTLYNYASRTSIGLEDKFCIDFSGIPALPTRARITARDARGIAVTSDMWITDPPYADAVNYHELSEFFLNWCDNVLVSNFPDWYTDSKRILAIKGNNADFRQDMVECYRNLAHNMSDAGMQIVMFTHQDATVWAELTLILWAAGLRVTAAWTIATETDTAFRKGNYVQGTVILVLRKSTRKDTVFLDEITHEVEAEVRRQLDSMLAIEDDSDPNFGDADYQLAAYAAALRVLTARPIYEIDPAKEIQRQRPRGEVGPVEQLIRNAVKIACDHLVPRGFDADLWKTLTPMERFYIKGLEVESHGEYRSGVYQELARGFGAADYDDLLANTRANETRLKTATEFGRRMLSGDGFGSSLVRQLLFAVQHAAKSEETRDGLNYLKTELPDYWNQRTKIIDILEFVSHLRNVGAMEHWRKDAEAATLLAGAVRHDHV